MKYLIVCLFLICACSKDDKTNCYECNIAGFNGQPGYKQDVCTDRIDTVQFRNSQGQPLASDCVPK